MEDKIEQLAHVLRKRHNINKIGKHIKRLLLENGIIAKSSKVDSFCINSNKPDCAFVAKVSADHNVFNKEITIMIKPDHSDKRCLRVAIQAGKRIFQNLEDKDKPRWSDKKVFKEEIKRVERDVREIMQKLRAA